jgi:hypothetical protein
MALIRIHSLFNYLVTRSDQRKNSFTFHNFFFMCFVFYECLDRQPSRSINIVGKDDISHQSSHSGR